MGVGWEDFQELNSHCIRQVRQWGSEKWVWESLWVRQHDEQKKTQGSPVSKELWMEIRQKLDVTGEYFGAWWMFFAIFSGRAAPLLCPTLLILQARLMLPRTRLTTATFVCVKRMPPQVGGYLSIFYPRVFSGVDLLIFEMLCGWFLMASISGKKCNRTGCDAPARISFDVKSILSFGNNVRFKLKLRFCCNNVVE